jgi:quercetin 2,3-dioxygenase
MASAPTTIPVSINIPNSTTKPTTIATHPSTGMKITTRPWNQRGHANYGWLYTFHSFAFASYYSPKHLGFGPLRVINEDRVEKGTGFGTHAHREFLIWSYVVSGELEHKDSLGNLEILKRGDVQFTSAGTGIRHSEYNRNDKTDNHFLQIWAKPNVRGLTPEYITRSYSDEQKTDALVRIMESVDRHNGEKKEDSSIPLHADLDMYASILSPGKTVDHELVAGSDRQLYLHVVMSGKEQPKTGGAKIKIGDVVLGEGDGAYVESPEQKVTIESVGEKPAEFLLFDLKKDEQE